MGTSPRDIPVLLAPTDSDDSVVVSRKGLAELLRKQQELEEENRHLREEVEHLRPSLKKTKEKLDQLKASLPVLGTDGKTAAAVGVPSSKVFFRQPLPPPDERKPTGGQPGHPGKTRERPTPNTPPMVLSLKECPKCAHSLGRPADSWSHPLTDLPEAHVAIYGLVVNRYKCPGCGERVHAPIPAGFQGEFGPRLKACVAQLRVLGMPLEKIREFLEATYGVRVSVASLLAMEEGVAKSLDGRYQGLWEEMRDARVTPHAEGDETSMPVHGETEWLWVGTSPRATVYRIQSSRSGEGAESMWAGYGGTLTHDGLNSYRSVEDAVHQMDLVHVNRWLQKVEVEHGIRPRGLLSRKGPEFTRAGRPPIEFLRFAEGTRSRLAAEVRWVEAHPQASAWRRGRRYARALGSMSMFLVLSWKDPDVVRIAGELGQRLETLFTFVRIPGTPWNSNEAEREIRVAVVHRKISAGRRSRRGAWVLERLLTVWRTCQKRGERFWDVMVQELGKLQAGPGPPSERPAS